MPRRPTAAGAQMAPGSERATRQPKPFRKLVRHTRSIGGIASAMTRFARWPAAEHASPPDPGGLEGFRTSSVASTAAVLAAAAQRTASDCGMPSGGTSGFGHLSFLRRGRRRETRDLGATLRLPLGSQQPCPTGSAHARKGRDGAMRSCPSFGRPSGRYDLDPSGWRLSESGHASTRHQSSSESPRQGHGKPGMHGGPVGDLGCRGGTTPDVLARG